MNKENKLPKKYSDLNKEIDELKFKLKALTEFVFEHHHRVITTNSASDEVDNIETSKGKVWVFYTTGRKEEGN
jgi:hypothetical protein